MLPLEILGLQAKGSSDGEDAEKYIVGWRDCFYLGLFYILVGRPMWNDIEFYTFFCKVKSFVQLHLYLQILFYFKYGCLYWSLENIQKCKAFMYKPALQTLSDNFKTFV